MSEKLSNCERDLKVAKANVNGGGGGKKDGGGENSGGDAIKELSGEVDGLKKNLAESGRHLENFKKLAKSSDEQVKNLTESR